MTTARIGDIMDDLPKLAAAATWDPQEINPTLDGAVLPAIDTDREQQPAPLHSGAMIFGRLLLMTLPLIVSDMGALALAGISSVLVVPMLRLHPTARLGLTTPLLVLPVLLAYVPWGLYTSVGMHPVVELRELTKLNTIAFIATLTCCIVTRAAFPWVAFFTLTWLASLALVPFFRSRVRPGFANRAWWGYPVLVVSSGNTARKVIKTMLKTNYSGLRPCGVVDPTIDRRGSVQGIPRVSTPSGVNSLIRSHGIRHCVIALPDMPEQQVMGVIDHYRALIPYLMVMSKSSDLPLLWGSSMDCGGMSGIGVRNGLMLAGPRLVKRLMDIGLSLFGIIVSLPLFALAALLVRFSSRGPMFFGHNRLGFGGQSFRAWKFRTMCCDSEAVLRELLKTDPVARAEWERDCKLRKDPRIIRFGQFLRQSSLDELPQFWNVLKGEMSLVGPRPIVTQEIDKYGKVFQVYKDVKPGITGLWQVSGRSNTTYEERVQLDNYYVRNWSPWLDIHILARTVEVLVRRHGAY